MNSYAFKRSYKREKVTATKSRNASMNGVRKNAPGKKAPRKNAPEKIAPRKITHRK